MNGPDEFKGCGGIGKKSVGAWTGPDRQISPILDTVLEHSKVLYNNLH
jgi:hypothetical protein